MPIPPGFVSVNVAPVCSSTRELVVARFGDEIFVGGAEADEVERAGVLDHRDDERARTVLALRVDGQTEVDPGLDALRLAALAAERRASSPGCSFAACDERERDEVGERDLLAAAGVLQRRR